MDLLEPTADHVVGPRFVEIERGEGLVAGRAIGQGMAAMNQAAQGTIQSGLDQMGVSGMEFGSMGAMQLFWIAAGALIAVAAAGVMRLSQEG